MAKLWYTLHVRPRFEKCVEAHLEAKGYEVFLPTCASRHRWSDRIKTLQLPLFSGYVFCRFALEERVRILRVDILHDVRRHADDGHPFPSLARIVIEPEAVANGGLTRPKALRSLPRHDGSEMIRRPVESIEVAAREQGQPDGLQIAG